MNKALAVLGTCNKYFCALLLASMVSIVFANTMLRYLFNSGIIMGEELVRFLFVWTTFLAVITVYYEHRHIAVTNLTDHLKPRTLALFSFIVNFLALFALGILFQGSVMYYNETTNMGQATGLPYKVMVIPVIIAAASCFLIVVGDMVKQWRTYRQAPNDK